MTRKKMALIAVIINLVLLAATFVWQTRNPPLNDSCEGTLTFNDTRGGEHYRYEGTVSMHFTPDGTGWFVLSGEVSRGEESWSVSRQETFGWHHQHDSLYELAIRKVEKLSHDQVPDGVFESFAAGLTAGNQRLINIERMPDNALVIGNVHTPLLVCAE